MRARNALALVAFLVVGCGDDLTLSVQVRTDIRPGLEFDEARVERLAALPPDEGEPFDERTVVASAADDWFAGRRVAEFTGLSSGRQIVRVTLRSAGAPIAQRVVVRDLRDSYALTVAITRGCWGRACPGAGDPDTALACVGGECVDPRCERSGDGECGPAQCAADPQCASAVPCAEGRCEDGLCMLRADDALCGEQEVCLPERGCEQRTASDAGVDAGADGGTDAGATDAGLPDAGMPDAGPPCSCTPGERRAAAGCDVCAEEICQDDCRTWECGLTRGAQCEHQGGSNMRMCTTAQGSTGQQYCLDRRPNCVWSTDCCVLGGGACVASSDCCGARTCTANRCQ